MSQDDPHDRSAQQSPITSDIAAPKTDLVAADAPRARLPDEPRSAARELFGTMGVSVQSGPSLSIAAFGELPEATQQQILANDKERTRRGFDLEEKQIEADAREKNAQRAHELAKLDRTLAHQETHDRRMHWSVIGAIVVAVAGTSVLFAMGHTTIATNIATALVSAGLAYQSGKGAGSKQTREQMQQLLREGHHRDDK